MIFFTRITITGIESKKLMEQIESNEKKYAIKSIFYKEKIILLVYNKLLNEGFVYAKQIAHNFFFNSTAYLLVYKTGRKSIQIVYINFRKALLLIVLGVVLFLFFLINDLNLEIFKAILLILFLFSTYDDYKKFHVQTKKIKSIFGGY